MGTAGVHSQTGSSHQRSERILFSEGSRPLQLGEAVVSAAIIGHESITYLVDARTGQSLDIRLASDNSHSGFRITAPAAPRALHSHTGQQAHFSGVLPRDGTYRIRIFLQPTAANSGEAARFSLRIALKNPG